MRLKLLLLLSAAGCGVQFVCAEDTVKGPSLGLSFEPREQSIHTLHGIAGAVTAGAPLFPDLKFSRAFVAPDGVFALGETGPDEAIAILDPSSEKPASTGVPAGASIVEFSPNGRSAVLYYGESRRIIVLRGLPAHPSLIEIDGSVLPGEIRSLAVRDDGKRLLAGLSGDGLGSLYSITSGGEYLYILPIGEPASIILFNSARDAAVADRGAGKVIFLKDVWGEPAVSEVELSEPVSGMEIFLSASRDGRKVFAIRGDGQIQALAPNGTDGDVVHCGCTPHGVTRLGANAVFRLATPAGEPTLLLDGDSGELRVVFVPPPQTPEPPRESSPAEEQMP